jgi:hypothetical protein
MHSVMKEKLLQRVEQIFTKGNIWQQLKAI